MIPLITVEPDTSGSLKRITVVRVNMATSESQSDGGAYVGARVSEEFRDQAHILARMKGKNLSDHIRDLLEEELRDADLPVPE